MQIKILTFTFLFFIQLHLLACSCIGIEDIKQAQQENFDSSDLVFVAEVIKVYKSEEYAKNGWFNNIVYELKVIEGFKGTDIGTKIMGHALTSCDIYPEEKETWLVYGKLEEKGMISMSECGLSRSISEPERILYPSYRPAPPPVGSEQDENVMYDINIQLAEIKLMAAKDLKEEILWLRSKQ